MHKIVLTLAPAFLALVGGILFGLSNSLNDAGAGSWIGLAVLGLVLASQRVVRKTAFVLIWAVPAYGVGLVWMSYFGLIPYIALTLYHAIFLIPVGMAAGSLKSVARQTAYSASVSGLFALGEWVRGIGNAGVSMVTASAPFVSNHPALQWVSVIGACGLGFLVCFSAMLAGVAVTRRSAAHFLIALAAPVLIVRAAPLLPDPKPVREIEVSCLQGVTSKGYENLETSEEMFRIYLGLASAASSRTPKPDLIVWPETSFIWYESYDSQIPLKLAAFAGAAGTDMVCGSLKIIDKSGLQISVNMAEGYASNGRKAGVYEKRMLTPFGEYVPLRALMPNLQVWDVPETDYRRGGLQPPMRLGAANVGVTICSESMFSWLSVQQVRHGADLLAVISNDGWLTRGPGALQLSRQSILRAVETGRCVVRASENGPTMIVSPNGRIIASSAMNRRSIVSGEAAICETKTIYVSTAEIWPLLIVLTTVAGFCLSREKAGRNEKGGS